MKIDIVITWVDNSDVNWLAKRNRYAKECNENIIESRYRDWNLMRFLFRGIEQFLPWVNNVFFVTDNQMPRWLNTDNKKLIVVDQNTLLPAMNCPSFNINAIEINLHKIPGLQEHFIYVNDDMFFLKPTMPEDFFFNGLPCDCAILSPVIVTQAKDVGSIAINNMSIINSHFEKKEVINQSIGKWINLKYGKELFRSLLLLPWHHLPGFYNPHLPQSFLKSTFVEVWDMEGDRLMEVERHRFRDYYADVNQWLMRYWQFCSGNFYPKSLKKGKYLTIANMDEVIRVLKSRRYSYICINDYEKINDISEYSKIISEELNAILPQKSSFEK